MNRRFAAETWVNPELAEDEGARLMVREAVCRELERKIGAEMKRLGYVPSALVEWTVVAGNYRMTQLGEESDDPTWISIRQAVEMDQALHLL